MINIDGNLSRGDCTFSAKAAALSLEDFVDDGFTTMKASVYARGVNEASLRGYHAALTAASPAVYHRHAKRPGRAQHERDPRGPARGGAGRSLFVAGVPDGICARSHTCSPSPGSRWPRSSRRGTGSTSISRMRSSRRSPSSCITADRPVADACRITPVG